MKNWQEEHCAERPEELQLIAPDLYMERRNIRKVEHEAEDGRDAYEEFVCESREITVSEYEMFKSIEAIDTGKAIDDYTMQLVEEGVL